MKKYIISTLAAVISLPAIAVAAPDGTITFNGSVIGQTCEVSVNNGSKDGTVTLPTVVSSLLAQEGQVAGATSFSIALKDCTPKEGNVRAFFQTGTNVDNASGTLKNNGTARNVHIQLLDVAGNVLKAGDESQRSGSTNSQALANGAATLSYSAQYYATGIATIGTVATSVEYSIDYF